MDTTVKIFSGRASLPLAKEIAKSYGIDLGNIIISKFSDGEFIPSFEETVRGSKVFIIQSTPPPSDNLMAPSATTISNIIRIIANSIVVLTNIKS